MRAALLALVLLGSCTEPPAPSADTTTFSFTTAASSHEFINRGDTGCYSKSGDPELVIVAVDGRDRTRFRVKGGLDALGSDGCRGLIPSPEEAKQPCSAPYLGRRWAWWVCGPGGQWIALEERHLR